MKEDDWLIGRFADTPLTLVQLRQFAMKWLVSGLRMA